MFLGTGCLLPLEPQRRNYFRRVTAEDGYWMEVEGQIPGYATAARRSRDFRSIQVGDGTTSLQPLGAGAAIFQISSTSP